MSIPFDGARFRTTAAPQPDWVPGQGLNAHAASPDFRTGSKGFVKIEPGKTEITPSALYKLMIGGIAPRPVALVGTLSKDGVPNLAPVSWYTMVSHDPPLVMLSFGGPEGRRKDSELNISETKEFTISSASEPFVEALNHASIPAPPGMSEFALSGLTPVASDVVSAPRVGESPFSLECTLDFSRSYTSESGTLTVLVIGRVVMLHAREDAVVDGTVDPSKTLPVTRFGGKLYGRTTGGYELERPCYTESASPAPPVAIANSTGTFARQVGTLLSSFP